VLEEKLDLSNQKPSFSFQSQDQQQATFSFGRAATASSFSKDDEPTEMREIPLEKTEQGEKEENTNSANISNEQVC
jgi:hypothetical protein